jgi:tetratricopeptide (TPR) repeat protein
VFDWLDQTLNLRRGLSALPTADVPSDLLYDDAPLEVVLYKEQGPLGTPVNVFEGARKTFQQIRNAYEQGRTQDVLSLTTLLVREDSVVPPDVLIPMIQILHNLLLKPGQTGEVYELAEQIWRLAQDQDNPLLLAAGITIAFEFAAEGRLADSDNMWKSITEVMRLRNHEDDGLGVAVEHAVRYWKSGHWKSMAERFSHSAAILGSIGVATDPLGGAPTPDSAVDGQGLLETAAAGLREFCSSSRIRNNPELLHNVQNSAIAVAVTEQLAGNEHPVTASCANWLLRLLQDEGYDAECLELARRALAIREQALGAEHPQLASSLNNLGLSLVKLGEFAEAEVLLRRTAEIRPRMPNPHYWLAQLFLRRQGLGDQAREESAWRRYLELGPPSAPRAEEARQRLAELSG